MHTLTHHSKKHGTSVVGLALAAAVGAALGLLFAPNEGAKTRRSVVSTVKELAQRFNRNREQIQHAVQEIFGEITDELEKDYIQVRSNILAAIDNLEDTTKLTKKKFENLVEETVEDYAQDTEWPPRAKSNLIAHLKSEWEELKEKLEDAYNREDEREAA